MAPEGTEPAIREAVRAGAEMIELDVRMTRDGRLVIFHDARLERTTDGRGVLARQTYRRLMRLDAGSWFHPRFASARILSVSQALARVPRRLGVILETKLPHPPPAYLRRLERILARSQPRERIMVSSFYGRVLAGLRAGGVERALICDRRVEASLRDATRLGCHGWHLHARLVTPAWVRRAHEAGMNLYVWTVDDERQARRLARWGVDGLFTNDPATLRLRLREQSCANE